MKRTCLGLFVAALFVCALPTAASANAIGKALGNLRWGMDDLAVKNALKGKLKGKALAYVEFDGKSTRWDSSPVGEEYTHGNEEAMLSHSSGESEDYYFFIGGELWKWVKVYPASSFGGRGFDKFAGKIRDRFGKGFEKQAEVNPGSAQVYNFLEFLDRNTRLRAVDKTSEYGKYMLVFESMDTVRSLSALRSNTIRRGGPKRPNALASAKTPRRSSADEDEEEAPTRSVTRAPAPTASSPSTLKNKKSIFSDEQQGDESAAAYNARKQRVIEEERTKQKRMHDRNEEAKKGKTLDALAGIDDNDPIGGMK
jgi:hypothetical protein